MPEAGLKDDDLNAFAEGLATHFVARAVGQDEDSARIVYGRPADQIVTGFLTPVRSDALPNAPDDDQLATDLPRDESFEQTNMGARWLVPRHVLMGESKLAVTVSLSVYVRRLPEYHDQVGAQWAVRRPKKGEAPPSAAEAPAVAVWTREELGAFDVAPIRFAELIEQRRVRRRLAPAVAERLSEHAATGLYPGRQAIALLRDVMESEDTFSAWKRTLPQGTWPVEWAPEVDVRVAPVATEPDLCRVAVRVVNCTAPVGPQSLDFVDPNIYAVGLRVVIPSNGHQPTVFRELRQSFRYDRNMDAIGINAHVRLVRFSDHLELMTDPVPVYRSPRLEARVIPDAPLGFTVLEQDPMLALNRIADAMEGYDAVDWANALERLVDAGELAEATAARHRFQEEAARFRRGVSLLANIRYPLVRRAFALMNQAMAHSNRGRFSAWRLFQLVFIVSQVPVLAGREYPTLRQDGDEDVDILWFAAGGGKTEAFLGVILWQAFFDRLRGKKLGVTAFVRFPLRLLTFQQLQRLGAALGSADLIRQRAGLGGAAFSIGYYVGSGTTPNDISPDLHKRYSTRGPDPKLQRLYHCPYCGAETSIGYDADRLLVTHRCTKPGSCPHGDTPLPVYVVDQDLYRFVPTVVVSTVDKMAQLGQNQRFGQLLGRFTVVCPEHGVSFLGANSRRCAGAKALDRGEHPTHCGTRPLFYGPFHDPSPSLLIQDELHLLSEELGTFDAHYETAVSHVNESLGLHPWKVIAATATIEAYEDHAWHLYLLRARQFPGPGPSAYESFYYTQSASKLGRTFIGLLGVGRKHTPAVSRVLALIYLELQLARELGEHDLGAALRRYSLGSLDLPQYQRLVFLYELVLTYVLTRKGSDQVAEAIESRVKRDVSDVLPNHGDLIVETFNGGASEAEMSAAVERIRSAKPTGPPDKRPRGIVATNVIGHGVDVDRFNVMVFAGFPRLVAEYIQASARVGRSFPGLSFFVATPQSERDRSIFDRFVKFHQYVDRLVDPSAVTRWPEAAMRRTLPGVLAGYLMAVAAPSVNSRLATVEEVLDAFAEGHPELRQEAIVDWVQAAYGADKAPDPDRYQDQLRIATQNRYSSVINQQRAYGAQPTNLQQALHSMQSLRDIDDPAVIRPMQSADAAILRRLIRG